LRASLIREAKFCKSSLAQRKPGLQPKYLLPLHKSSLKLSAIQSNSPAGKQQMRLHYGDYNGINIIWQRFLL